MSVWLLLWIFWGAVFFAIEIPAIRSRRPTNETLSDHVWSFLRWSIKGIPLGVIVFGTGWALLTSHFFLRWP